MKAHAVHYTSARTATGRDDWRTPPALYEALHREFGFDTDAAATCENTLCLRHLSPTSECAHDGDSRVVTARPGGALGGASWGNVAWLNPPYSMLRGFLAMARTQCLAHGTTVVALIPARTDTIAWHDSVMRASEVRLIRGRVRFVGASAGAPFPSAIVVWRDEYDGPPRCSSWAPPR